MLELLRREFEGRVVVAVATDRDDGDLHPGRVDPGELMTRQLAVAGRTWTMVDEVHGVEVHRCAANPEWVPTSATADIVVARPGDGPVAIWAADCAPVILFDRDGSTIACHAGWRGLAGGVIDAAVAATGCPVDVLAVLGPTIHPCCYEFGAADLERVAVALDVAPDAIAGRTRAGQLALDVPATVRHALGRHGISLVAAGPCTGCDPRWYSHRVRRDLGRHAVVAWTETTRSEAA